MKISMIKNQNGQSLIQVLVAVGISGIVTMAMITLTQNQYREVSTLTERLAKAEVSAQLISALTSSSVCSYMMSNFSNHTFDGRNVNSLKPKIPITKILAGANANAPTIVEEGKAVSPMTMKVISNEIYAQVRSGDGDQYYGVLTVNFQTDKLTRPMRHIEIPISFAVNPSSPPQSREIEGCAIGPGDDKPSESSAKAYFSWNGKNSSGNNVKITEKDGVLYVKLETPMANSRYSVICNGSMKSKSGTEMQLFAFNKKTSSFEVSGSHGAGSDPIGFVDCVVFGI